MTHRFSAGLALDFAQTILDDDTVGIDDGPFHSAPRGFLNPFVSEVVEASRPCIPPKNAF